MNSITKSGFLFHQERRYVSLVGSTSVGGPPSPHQLTVTWASQSDLNETNTKAKQMLSHLESTGDKTKRLQEDKSNELSTNSVLITPLDTFAGDEQHHPPSDDDDVDDEEYSVSVSTIMQRRASIRGNRKRGSRSSRRASSPMDFILDTVSQTGDRRPSSVYTTSSGETAVSVDDGTNQDSTQEQIYENIRIHKEVIQSVKLEPWSIRKKLKLVRQAKTYVARHEGALQERFALSRSLRDLWARFKILMAARWRHWKRETSSFLTVLIPWELRIKEIESHFGSGVASYFTFLRWLLWVNIMMTIPLVAFVITPEVLSTNPNDDDPRKKMSERELKVAGNLFTIWEFEGYLKYSPLFYGYYSSKTGAVQKGYNLPLAYFLTAVAVYIYSFVATLRKMAENSRNSKLSSKDDECIFSWKLFTGWDFMIGHAETAHNRIASVVVGFKEALLEEAEKKKDKRNWRIILQRILVNILVIILLAASGYTVVTAVDRSENIGTNASWFRRNEVNVIMTLLSFFLPMIFDALGLFENWHPRQQLRLQLARIMILNLLNLYSLMFSFIYKITGKDETLQLLKEIDQNATVEKSEIEKLITTLTAPSTVPTMDLTTTPSPSMYLAIAFTKLLKQRTCFTVPVNCSVPRPSPTNALTTSILLLNLSTPMLPTTWTTPSYDPTTQLPSSPWSYATSSTTEFLSSTSEATDSTSGVFSSTTDLFTSTLDDFNWTTSSNVYDTTDLNLEDQESEFNTSFFDYHDYFDNFESSLGSYDSVSYPDTDIYGLRIRRSVTEFNENITEVASTEITELAFTESTTTSPFEELTEADITSSSTTENFSEFNTIEVTSMISINDSLDFTASTGESPSPASVMYDKDIEVITTGLPYETEVTGTSVESTVTALSTYGIDNDSLSTTQGSQCTQEVCITLSDFFATPSPITEGSADTPATSLNVAPTTISQLQIEYHQERLRNVTLTLESVRRNLTSMCWETSLGQELSKVIVFDMIMSIAAPLCIDFLRALFVRYMNKYWCWDMEKTFPQYGDFKIAESILNLVYNQGQVWMGIFFSPGLVIINFVKLMILMYLRSWIVLTCNVPHEVVFKASKSNNFYLSLLLTMLFLCVLPVGYAIVWLRPSWHCGPFSDYDRISEFFTDTLIKILPPQLHQPLEYLTSPSTVIPLLLLLTLIIYYLVSLTGALREANQDLRNQLHKEREEERKKMFKVPEEKTNEEAATTLSNRWRKVLEASSPVSPTQNPPDFNEDYKNQARKELIAKIMKKALRKGSATSDDDSSVKGRDEDDTDTEHHDPLPLDEEAKVKPLGSSRLQMIRRTRKPSLIDIVQIAKSEHNKMRDNQTKGRFKTDKTGKFDPISRHVHLTDDSKRHIDKDNDPDTNSRVVSERRASLLRKEPHGTERIHDKHSQGPKGSSNFAIVNEKDQDTLKKHWRKSPLASTGPKVFTFDEKAVESQVQNPREAGRTPSPSSRSGQESTTPETEGHKIFNIPKQGRKKLGSFMNIVREAVKRVEPHSASSESASPRSISSAPESDTRVKLRFNTRSEQALNLEPIEKLEKSTSLKQKRIARSAPIDSEEDDQLDPTSPTFKKGSLRKTDKPSPPRQDSQASVWSENIPMITITPGSEENILKCTADKSAVKPETEENLEQMERGRDE